MSDRDWLNEPCPYCAEAFGLAIPVCSGCGYDPLGYYRDDDGAVLWS